MALNFAKAPCLRNLYVRTYAACPSQAIPVGGLPDYKIKSSTLTGNLQVISAENQSLVSRVAIVFRAGARYESCDNLGTTHILRIATGLSTKKTTQFILIRNIQEYGAQLTCSVDREIISYTLEGTRSAVEKTLPFLAQVAAQQCIRPWELAEQLPRIKLDLATRPFQLRAVDLLHKAAYRSVGLGNSLFIAKHQIGKVSVETLQHYIGQYFSSDRAAVVGLGIDHKFLEEFAKCLELKPCTQSDPAAEYKGGEIRSDKGGDLAHVAIAGKGGSLRNAKEALSFAVLQRALGAGSSIKYTKQNKAPFGKFEPTSGKIPASITALNVSYSDSGLFGALITAPSSSTQSIVENVAQILRNGKIEEDDFVRGKQQFKTSLLWALEKGSTAIEDMSSQAVLIGTVANASQIMSAVDALTISDVNKVAHQVACSKFTIASVGNLRCVPFLDDLK